MGFRDGGEEDYDSDSERESFISTTNEDENGNHEAPNKSSACLQLDDAANADASIKRLSLEHLLALMHELFASKQKFDKKCKKNRLPR